MESLRLMHRELQGLLATQEMSETSDVVLIPASWAPCFFPIHSLRQNLATLAKGKAH